MKQLFTIFLITICVSCASVAEKGITMTPYRIVLAQLDNITVVSKKVGYHTLIKDDLSEITQEVWEVTLANHATGLQCVTMHWSTLGFKWSPVYDKSLSLPGNSIQVAGYLKQIATPFGDDLLMLPGQARVKALVIKHCNDGD